MIVPAMNYQQMYLEFLKCYLIQERKIIHISSKIRRKFLKCGQIYHFLDYTDPRKNKWGIQILLFNKKKYRTTSFLHFFHPEKGYCALELNHKDMTVNFYSGHFFKRYNERLTLDLPKSIDKMKHYFFSALDKKMKFFPDGRFQAELPMGIGFGYRCTPYWNEFKTFITNDMLKGNQRVISDELQKELSCSKFLIDSALFKI